MSVAVAAPSQAELELATLRLAIHEAGHAVAAVLLGHRIDGLTIELDQGESGCCLWSSEPPPQPSPDTAGSVLFSDWKVRQRLEQRLIVSLAGIIAVEVWAPPRAWLPAAAAQRPGARATHGGTRSRRIQGTDRELRGDAATRTSDRRGSDLPARPARIKWPQHRSRVPRLGCRGDHGLGGVRTIPSCARASNRRAAPTWLAPGQTYPRHRRPDPSGDHGGTQRLPPTLGAESMTGMGS